MVKCKNCLNNELIPEVNTDGTRKWFHFCRSVMDSLDIEEERDCEHYVVAANAERIRAMTDEELALVLGSMADKMNVCYCCPIGKQRCDTYNAVSCERAFDKWLQSPVEV